jgi:hypothetical protein
MPDHVATNPVWLDAIERAWRTMWQGFIVDALIAVGLGLMFLMETGDITSPLFWSALGVLVGKSFLVSFASFLARLKVAPKESVVKSVESS